MTAFLKEFTNERHQNVNNSLDGLVGILFRSGTHLLKDHRRQLLW